MHKYLASAQASASTGKEQYSDLLHKKWDAHLHYLFKKFRKHAKINSCQKTTKTITQI